MMPADRTDEILDRWARRDAAKAIAIELGIASRAIYQIVAAARERHDPRATFRKGRASAGRPTQDRKRIVRAGNRRRPWASVDMLGWWFGRRTIVVTTLGTGSADCHQVEVSVSDVLRNLPQEPAEEVSVRLSPARSFREALADWSHQAPRQPAGGPLPTEQAQPPQRR